MEWECSDVVSVSQDWQVPIKVNTTDFCVPAKSRTSQDSTFQSRHESELQRKPFPLVGRPAGQCVIWGRDKMVFQLVGVGAVILSRRYRNPLWFVFFLFFLLFVASLVLPPGRRKKKDSLNQCSLHKVDPPSGTSQYGEHLYGELD